MNIIKLRDVHAAHEPSFFNTKNQDNIIISRDGIDKNDVVIYTDKSVNTVSPISRCNIACLFESPELTTKYYDYVLHNQEKFDIILTFHKSFLDLNPKKFKLQLFGTTWINEAYRKVYEKERVCSIIASNKATTTGHKLRHTIIDYLVQNNFNNIDFYGARFNNLPGPTTQLYTQEHSGQHISNKKINGLKSYMFSITIENCKSDYFFTEKLIDCFLTGTVPIYWGCPSIHDFFNIKGILMFDTLHQLIDILNTLTFEKYTEMLPYIKENFEKAKKYTRYKFNEEAIFECINK